MPAFSLSAESFVMLDVLDHLETEFHLSPRTAKAYARLVQNGAMSKKALASLFKQTETAVAGWLRELIGLGLVVKVGALFRAETFFSALDQSINVSMPIVQEKTNGTEKDITPREAATESDENFSALAEEAAQIIGRGVKGSRLVAAIRYAWKDMQAYREHFADLIRKKAEALRMVAFRSPGAYFWQTLKNAIAQREWEAEPEVVAVPVAVNAPDEYVYQRPVTHDQRTTQRPAWQQYRRPSNVFLQREKKDDKYYDHIYAKFSD